jgi:hypothetical protein
MTWTKQRTQHSPPHGPSMRRSHLFPLLVRCSLQPYNGLSCACSVRIPHAFLGRSTPRHLDTLQHSIACMTAFRCSPAFVIFWILCLALTETSFRVLRMSGGEPAHTQRTPGYFPDFTSVSAALAQLLFTPRRILIDTGLVQRRKGVATRTTGLKSMTGYPSGMHWTRASGRIR